MKFTIDRPIEGSYSKEITYEQTWDFSNIEDETRRENNKKWWIELNGNPELIKSWIDDDGVCHRIKKETIEIIDVTTIEELYAITKANDGKIVLGTNLINDFADGWVDGWIEIYDDYRE